MTTTSDPIILSSTNPFTWFPLKPCSRCGGSGEYSWCQMYGTTCFSCMVKQGQPGSGFAVANKKTGELLTEYRKAIKAARETTGSKLQVGDRVWVLDGRIHHAKVRGGEWVEVVEVVETDRPAGKSKSGNFDDYTPWLVSSWQTEITLANGIETTGGQNIVRRCGDVDVQPYVEAAWETVPKTLQKARKVVGLMMGRIS